LRKLPAPTEIQAEKARRNLREFISQAWHVVEPSTPFVGGWHIDAICEHLEAVSRGEIRNLLINVPPRHMKSLAVTVFWPAWEWATWPERRWLFASYALGLSVRDSVKCRRLIESPWYQANWCRVFELTSDQNTKTRFDNSATGYRLATSVGGSATGEGGDRITIDDPHQVSEANSDAIRESTLTWWDETMSTRLNDPRAGARVIVAQRVHELDLSGHVLEQGGWEHLCLPAEFEGKTFTSIGWEDPRTVEGELLWPERFGPTEIEALKRSLGSYAAAGQLQQRPAPAGGGMLNKSWWRFYQEPPAHFDSVLQSWDLAFKDGPTSDYVVGQVWGAKGADRYLLDQLRARMDFPATVAAIRALTAKHPSAGEILIEDAANGAAAIASLRREIGGIIAVRPDGGKIARAAAVSPQIEAGNVYLPDLNLQPWVADLILECSRFPKGAHDDQVDALTQALNRFSNEPGWLTYMREDNAAHRAPMETVTSEPKTTAFSGYGDGPVYFGMRLPR
jgi:predicted phage terminase large subunit-like protein